MSAADVPPRYRRIRAPRDDGAALIDPPISDAVKLVAANRALAATWDRASGLPFAQWRSDARGYLLLAADANDNHTGTAKEKLARLLGPFVMAGHQPSLFHPGVWLKNFLLDRIAKEVGATAANLLVDNDTVRHAGIRVPAAPGHSPPLIDVPFDAPAPEMPWEQRPILDLGIFRGFAGRVSTAFDAISPMGPRQSLLIDSVWPHAAENAMRPVDPSLAGTPCESWERSLGHCLAAARHAVERSFGLNTLEVPISLVYQFGCFSEFLGHVLSRWDELQPIYNAALRQYRTVNHIRSRNHPAPDLSAEGEWLETPLWIWDRTNPQRRRAFVRLVGNGFELSDRGGIRVPGANADRSVKIRPRALITTMFARVIVSDLFIHGIGGAKYDELTDVLIRRFFGIEPPAYMTATATFRLPIERPGVTADDVRAIERRIRDTVHHPESFADELGGNRVREFAVIAEHKRELIAAGWQEKQKKAWHDRVTECNDRMTALLGDVRQRFVQEREKLLADLHAANLLGSREFSFVLFPEETLPRQLLDLSAARP